MIDIHLLLYASIIILFVVAALAVLFFFFATTGLAALAVFVTRGVRRLIRNS
ncbi:hypothetical protein [Paenarthrobacter histidinolovorans]|uniref:Uncharacterized protein n=1 Tax=Paenarthrobacter histidinolovorans TaxID=43664 RepID=A0ABW8N3C9_9MICC